MAERGTQAATDGSGRLRLAVAEVTRTAGSGLAIRVRLERGEEAWEAETSGVGLETMELRLGAEATLTALAGVAGDERPPLRLVGVKVVHAFDADVVLVAIRDAAGDRRLIGAVAVRGSLAEAAARAVLDATNRVLLHPGSASEEPGGTG